MGLKSRVMSIPYIERLLKFKLMLKAEFHKKCGFGTLQKAEFSRVLRMIRDKKFSLFIPKKMNTTFVELHKKTQKSSLSKLPDSYSWSKERSLLGKSQQVLEF